MESKKIFFVSVLTIIFVIGIVLVSQGIISAASATTFNKSNVETWASSKENIGEFEKMSDKEKTEAWNKADIKQKDAFLNNYKKDKGINADFKNLNHKDLSWQGTKLISQKNSGKTPSFDFNNARKESLKSVTYDDKAGEMIYNFEKGDVKNQIRIDDGLIDKDGFLVKQNSVTEGGFLGIGGTTKLVDEKIAQVTSGNGDMSYKNGKLILPAGSERGIFIGTSYYESFKKTDETIISPRKDGGVDVFNTKISIVDKPDAQVVSAIFTTTNDKDKDGMPKIVAFFDGKPVPSNVASTIPYAAVDTVKGTIEMNDNSNVLKSSTFMKTEIYKNFDTIKGSGEQVWVKNGNAQFDFKGNDILFVDNMRRGTYGIGTVSNLNVPEGAKTSFTFKDYGQGYTDFYNKEGTLVDSGTLISETSGMYVYGPRGKQLGGQAETSYSNIKYDEKYNQGVFQGTEEERLAAIARDPNTVVEIHGTPSIDLPGQLIATEVLSNLDYQFAVNQLRLQEKGMDIETGKTLLGGLFLSQGGDRSKVASSIVSSGTAKDINEANKIIDGYIISQPYNYNPDYPYSQVTSENINQMPSINRFLYELSMNHAGTVDIPEVASLSSRPSSSGGVSTLQFSGDGVYLDGQKVPGVSPQVASALRSTMGGQLLNFEQGVAERQTQIQKYGTQINTAGYPFDINDYKTIRYESNVQEVSARVLRPIQSIREIKSTGQSLLDNGRAQLNGKQSKYSYYVTNGKLPTR